MARAGGSALISARRSPTGSTAGRLGTRWAAAALALGLGLAAPGMSGLALADSPDTPSPATSAAAADPRAAATRPATTRAANPARDTQARSTPRAAAATGPANPRHNRATEIIRAAESLDSATAGPSAASAESLPMPVPDPPTGDSGDSPESGNGSVAVTHIDSPAVVDSSASSDRSVSAAGTGLITAVNPTASTRPVRTAAPTLDAQPPTTIHTALSAITQQINQVLNGLINWLSALPASPLTPVTDFLAGALQLVRRALTPVLGGVDGTYVYFTNRTDQTLAVAQVPNGELEGPEAEPRYLAPGETSDFYGYNRVFFDVRLRIYTATQTDTGAWQKGELREVIGAVNQWDSRPTVVINLDPYYPGYSDTLCGSEDDRCNRVLVAPFDRPWWDRAGGFKVGEAWFADYDLRGPFQSGQTGTYIERLSDRSDDYKVFAIEVFKIPTGAISDIGVPQYGGAVPAGRVNQK